MCVDAMFLSESIRRVLARASRSNRAHIFFRLASARRWLPNVQSHPRDARVTRRRARVVDASRRRKETMPIALSRRREREPLLRVVSVDDADDDEFVQLARESGTDTDADADADAPSPLSSSRLPADVCFPRSNAPTSARVDALTFAPKEGWCAIVIVIFTPNASAPARSFTAAAHRCRRTHDAMTHMFAVRSVRQCVARRVAE